MKKFNAFKFGAWFFLAISILAIVVSFRYLKYVATGGDWLTIVYLAATLLSHFSALSFLIYGFLFVPVALLFKNKQVLVWYATTIGSISLLVLILDTFVYDLYRFHINGFVLDMVFGGAFSEIFVFDLFIYLKVAFFVVLLTGIIYLIARIIWNLFERDKLKGGKQIACLLLALLIGSHLLHAWAYATSYRSIQQSSLYFPLYFPLRANKLLSTLGVAENNQKHDWEKLQGGQEKAIQYPLKPLTFDTVTKYPNILFVLMDAWQFETFSKEITPNIYRFSQGKILFSRHYSGSNGTRGGIFSMFYGMPSLYWEDFLINRISPVFLDELQKRNYEMKIFASAALVSPEFDKTVFSKVNNLRTHTPGKNFTERDENITKEFIQWMSTSTSQKPFFGFLFYDSPHNYNLPYWLPHPFKPYWENVDHTVLNNDFNPVPFYNSYKNTVWFCDSLIQQVLSKLEEKKLLENTIVVITSDHGQEFNENKKNYWGHTSNFSKYQLQVPCIISWPGKAAEVINRFTSHYDLVPTLMQDILKCRNPLSDYSFGKNLFDTTSQRVFVAGSKEHFAFIDLQKNHINTVNFNGSMTVTDMHLNELDIKPDAKMLNDCVLDLQRYYKPH
ncbi:MAG TPA: DUF3413 domain-containing protein [Bacteroidia bacterium]|nr:DUF3413 domain-containing protein [Bacteroidia bacterium]HMU20330.1 DUF3413 domain-containing protein [Bacteroidia bacterium]